MRIALFYDLPSGGAKRTLYEQVKRLAERHEIDLFSLNCANHEFADIRPFANRVVIEPFAPSSMFGSPLGRLNSGLRIRDIWRLRQVMGRLAGEMNRGEYDVALVHPCQLTFSPAVLRFLHLPSLYYRQDVVRWVQDPPIPRPYNRQGDWRNKLDGFDPLLAAYRKILTHEDYLNTLAATRVVTNSYFMRESLYRVYGVSPAVCYHGVDTERFHPLHLQRENFVVSVGMLNPVKGFDFVIQSLSRIAARSRPRLVLVSNSRSEDEARYLDDLATQHQVELEFKTMVDDQELVRLYNQALCTVYAPVMESFGLVPLESMACETPVVGIREGGVRETVVHKVTGLLADRDPEEFSEAVVTLVKDQELRERLGQQAREFVLREWSWEQAIARLNRHLQEVVELKGVRSGQ